MTNKAKPKAVNASEDTSLLEKVLAFGFIGSVAVTVLTVLVILLAAFTDGVWIPTGLGLIPMLVLPFGFLCLVALLIVSSRRKKQSSTNTP